MWNRLRSDDREGLRTIFRTMKFASTIVILVCKSLAVKHRNAVDIALSFRNRKGTVTLADLRFRPQASWNMSRVLLSPLWAAFLARWRLSFSIERIWEGIDLKLVLFNFFAGVEKKIIEFANYTKLRTRYKGRRTLRQLGSFLRMSDDDTSEVGIVRKNERSLEFSVRQLKRLA